MAIEPGTSCLPQIGIRLEILSETKELLVVGSTVADEHFIAVKLASLVNAVLDLLVDFVNTCGNILVLFQVLVLLELEDGLLKVGNVLKELFLLELHILDHLLLQLLEHLSLGLHNRHDALWAAK